MFNPANIIINAFVKRLRDRYDDSFGMMNPEYGNIIAFFGKLSLENIANSDAPYHDMDHTIMVTEVTQTILHGKHLSDGQITPSDWMHCIIAALCHDIGYVRGVCKDDKNGKYVISMDGDFIDLPQGATDASLSTWHVDRSILFVKQWFQDVDMIDEKRIMEMIDYTRFPVPEDKKYHIKEFSYPGLIRAADLIGQMGDINYMKKTSALFTEFSEIGTAKILGYNDASDLRKKYPAFFWKVVKPLIQPYLRSLRVTQLGKQWLSNLYSHILIEEHEMDGFGVERSHATLGNNKLG